MSNTENNQENALAQAWGVDLTKAAAFLDDVAQNAFIEELGNYGIAISTHEELADMVKLSQLIDEASVAQQGSNVSLVKAAVLQLESSLGKNSPEADSEMQARLNADYAKSAQLASDESVAKHILALLSGN